MNDNFDNSRNSFEKLLTWLGENRETGGFEYEKIRSKLIKIFYAKGCHSAEELADETIERVTKNIDELLDKYTGNPAFYFYGVAKNVFLEYLRKPKTEEIPTNYGQIADTDETTGIYLECLRKCVENLKAEDRQFILEYYDGEKRAKIDRRRLLQDNLKMNENTFHVYAFRIRKKLEKCVVQCAGKK